MTSQDDRLPNRYKIFITQDGSPTLEWTGENGCEEKMHHSGGALSESIFIYQECLHRTLQAGWPVRILSLGLGLGYNEIIAIGTLAKAGIHDWKIWSFEAVDFLRDEFCLWLEGKPSSLMDVYDQILKITSETLQFPISEFKGEIVSAWRDGRLELRRAFPEDSNSVRDCTCVYYDAFSKKMDPELWAEETLAANLRTHLSDRCVLSTYAATGTLNRALKTLGFRLLPRPGFLGKRESTLAIRE